MGNYNIGNGNPCPSCSRQGTEIDKASDSKWLFYFCPNCGSFFKLDPFELEDGGFFSEFNNEKLALYLFHHKDKGVNRPVICTKEEYSKWAPNYPHTYNLTPEMVEAWYPKTFAEKIDLILLYLQKHTKFIGEKVDYSYLDLCRIYCIENRDYDEDDYIKGNREDEIDFISNYLRDQEYLSISSLGTVNGTRWSHQHTITILPKGLERIEQLQRDESKNKDVFVSMSFSKKTNNTRDAIRAGIVEAGFSPEFIDEIIHNHQIVPEMLRLIRECRFLILDITEPNFGAYYEAGYAQGLGKEVIVCCKKEVFDKRVFSCEKLDLVKAKEKADLEKYNCPYYEKLMRPHFDIAQKQTLVWKDYADLTKQLTEWIKAIV